MNIGVVSEPASAGGAAGHVALVLAAQRRNTLDPLAVRGNGNKNFMDLNGRPMICWVLETLLSAPEIREVRVSTEVPERITAMTEFAADIEAGRLSTCAPGINLYDSVRGALTGCDAIHFPTLVTTGDNPLLTGEMLTWFCKEVAARRLHAAISMTAAAVMKAHYPDGQRRFYGFADGAYSNCNLFMIGTPAALHAARIFQGGGQFRKHQLRMIKAFGLVNVALYFMRRLRLDQFEARLTRAFGVPTGFVVMPFAEACIDVDNERTWRIATEILKQRRDAAPTETGTLSRPVGAAQLEGARSR